MTPTHTTTSTGTRPAPTVEVLDEALAVAVAAAPAARALYPVESRFAPGLTHLALTSPNGPGWVALACVPHLAAACTTHPGSTLRRTGAAVTCPTCLTAT